MGRERRFPPLPETSILELLTLRRTDLTVNKDLDLQQDHPPHPRRETLTTSKTKTLDSSRGSKPDHNNFLNSNRDNSNSSNNSNHRDSLSNSSNSSNHRDSLSNSSNSSNHRDNSSSSNSSNHRDNSSSSNNNNHRDSQRPLHPQGSSVFLSKSSKESTGKNS